MAPTNSQAIAVHIELLEQEADRFIGNLEQQLEQARSQRLTEQTQKDLETQIEQARVSYEAILKPKRIELAAARHAEAEALKKTTAEIEANAAEVKEEMKRHLLRAWIQAGGDPDVFDQQFPAMYAAEMTKRALGEKDGPTESKRAVASLIHRNF